MEEELPLKAYGFRQFSDVTASEDCQRTFDPWFPAQIQCFRCVPKIQIFVKIALKSTRMEKAKRAR
jgi:hypothetical protein